MVVGHSGRLSGGLLARLTWGFVGAAARPGWHLLAGRWAPPLRLELRTGARLGLLAVVQLLHPQRHVRVRRRPLSHVLAQPGPRQRIQPEPGAPAFISVGDQVEEGQTLLIVEAMKTMNQIPAPRSGRIARILVDDGSAVEFGTPLVILE